MEALADLARDDDAPPASGVRPRTVTVRRATASSSQDEDVLAEVMQEVFFEVLGVVRALSPLQGAWLRVGAAQMAVATLEITTWQIAPRQHLDVLRARWPELVPGAAGVDRLAHLMVDALCA